MTGHRVGVFTGEIPVGESGEVLASVAICLQPGCTWRGDVRADREACRFEGAEHERGTSGSEDGTLPCGCHDPDQHYRLMAKLAGPL